MSIRAVVFDVGETLVDEDGYWRRVAALAGVRPHVLTAALGVTIARGEDHTQLWQLLGVERPDAVAEVTYEPRDLWPDVVPCLTSLRAVGYLVGAAGNQTAALESWLRDLDLPLDFVASSASLGARKPRRAFFEGIAAALDLPAGRIAYVGDRVDNDVTPAIASGFVAVQVHRGAWAMLQAPDTRAAAVIDSLDELPRTLRSLP